MGDARNTRSKTHGKATSQRLLRPHTHKAHAPPRRALGPPLGRSPSRRIAASPSLSSARPALCGVGRIRRHAEALLHRPLDALPPQPAGERLAPRASSTRHRPSPRASRCRGQRPWGPSWPRLQGGGRSTRPPMARPPARSPAAAPACLRREARRQRPPRRRGVPPPPRPKRGPTRPKVRPLADGQRRGAGKRPPRVQPQHGASFHRTTPMTASA